MADKVLTPQVIAAMPCADLSQVYHSHTLPAGYAWQHPRWSLMGQGAQIRAQERAFLAAMGQSAPADENAMYRAFTDYLGGAAFYVEWTIQAGLYGASAAAAYKRLTSNPAHGAGDCHQSPAEDAAEAVVSGLQSSGLAAQIGKIALTLVFVLIGGAMVLLGLRQLAAPRIPKESP